MTAQAQSACSVPLATTPPDRPNPPVPPLLRLPLELHHLVAAQLSLPGHLALRLTHPYLYNALAAPFPAPSLRNLDSCARLAVRTYLSPYFAGCTGESKRTSLADERSQTTKVATRAPAREKARLRSKTTSTHCLLCAAPYAPRLFKSTSSPAVDAADHGIPITSSPLLSSVAARTSSFSSLPVPLADSSNVPPAVEPGRQKLPRSHPDWDVLALPDGVCAWHVSRFARVVREWPAGLPRPPSASDDSAGHSSDASSAEGHQSDAEQQQQQQQQWSWLAVTSTLCPHCGAVAAFRTCACCTPSSITSTSTWSCGAPRRGISSSPPHAAAAADTPTRTHVIGCEASATSAPRRRSGAGDENAATTTTTTTSSSTGTTNIAGTVASSAAATPVTSGGSDDSGRHCQTCALRPVTVYVRHLPTTTNDSTARTRQNQAWNISSYRFWRDAHDRLWVREEGFSSPPTETTGLDDGDVVVGRWTWGARSMWAWAWGREAGWGRHGERGIAGMRRERRGEVKVVDVPVRWVAGS
ncbi:uncharacterized protein J3D65DRAFT_610266 [Phyllosticta citribraziliensis]|uniref:F-box domain-containing protein n=1 Tax=Phyllosticta citribraziliensis TaxID=989973 RepID=A0ABR1M9W8_9PEZI